MGDNNEMNNRERRKFERRHQEEMSIMNKDRAERVSNPLSAEEKYAVASRASVKAENVRPIEKGPAVKLSLREWWEQVFMYHYKWYALGGLAAVILLVSFIYSVATNYKPDTKIVVVMQYALSDETFEPLRLAAEQAVGDANGDGKVFVLLDTIFITYDGSDLSQAAPDMLMLSFVEEYSVLYLVDEAGLNILRAYESAALLSDIGLEGKYAYLEPLDDAIPIYNIPLISAIGFTEDYPLYAVFRVAGTSKNADQFYQPGITALDAILEYAG